MRSSAARVDHEAARHRPSMPVERRGAEEPDGFGPDSMLWDDVGDTLFFSSILCAFLLQAMHPTISAAVDRHSVFRTDPFGRAVRSADSVMLWVYGGTAAIEEGHRLRGLHRPIKGIDDQGNRYSALDPEAYAWVHATAFVATVTAYPLARGRELTAAEQELLYSEHLQLGEILQVPPRMMPDTPAAYWDYYHAMVSDRLERTVVAREVLDMTTTPPLPLVPRVLGPLAWPARRALGHLPYLLVVGGLTEDARDVLGVRWTPAHDAELHTLMALVRLLHSRLPERLRYLPLALHARRHARELDAIRNRATVAVA